MDLCRIKRMCTEFKETIRDLKDDIFHRVWGIFTLSTKPFRKNKSGVFYGLVHFTKN